MTSRILVINPNSSQSVTDGIDAAIAPLRMTGGPQIDCVTLAEGPPAIESQEDVESVVLPMCRYVRDHPADAYVIACYSDPGLFAVREATDRPVLGIAECSMLSALTLGERFAIIAILPGSVKRQQRYVRLMGLGGRYAGSRAVNLGVLDLADRDKVRARLIEVGAGLRDARDADVVIMGCTGMAAYRDILHEALAIPVLEPSQCAVAMAIGAVRLGWRR